MSKMDALRAMREARYQAANDRTSAKPAKAAQPAETAKPPRPAKAATPRRATATPEPRGIGRLHRWLGLPTELS